MQFVLRVAGRLLLSSLSVSLLACGGNGAATAANALPGSDPDAGTDPGAKNPDGGVENPADSSTPGFDASTPRDASATDTGTATGRLQTVFVIVMENHSWSTIKMSDKAPYINGTLIPMGAHAENYKTPLGNHPSEPNYIWLEAGDNLGITNDDEPSANHQSTADHLTAQLSAANIPWKAYVEGISGDDCPLTGSGVYAPKHTPQLYFDDVTSNNDPTSTYCKAHIRPYTELADDLTKNTVARYNFITPDLCNDMHGFALGCGTQNFNEIGAGDDWLRVEVPKILASSAYKNNGVLFIVWDEGDTAIFGPASDGPIPMIVLSPKAKANYSNNTTLTHSSMLRTFQEILGVGPLLRDAATATNLSEFFTSYP